jgi:hypothetical protein
VQLDRDARCELEEYKSSVTPSPAAREANWEAIASRALRGEAPEWVDDDDVVPRRPRVRSGWIAGGLLVAAAAAVVMVMHGGRLLHPNEPAGAPASASYELRGDSASEGRVGVSESETIRLRGDEAEAMTGVDASQGEAEPEPEPEPLESDSESDLEELAPPLASKAEESPRRDARASMRTKAANTRRAPDEGDQQAEVVDPLAAVRAESSLVGRARAALRDEDPSTALRLLDEHARRFPSGELEQERELLRVSALCDAQRVSAAEKVAGDFRRAFPGSPLLGHLGATCVGDR